ncbi:MAG: class I SAM-dependent methyltransferase [Acaryochloridaceae cyanobacterium RU_4_10]|nr:class I SAM-dependent methyltransferase [Acaryochloridaceae cyanobacterium RU_4_10]
MTTATPASPDLASRLVNGILSIKPIANFAKHQARSMMIERAESVGVQWTKEATTLRNRGIDTWAAELQSIENPNLQYPDYYLKPFHAYETGNLSWDAATEVEVASYAAHARIWSDAGSKEGDARLRQTFHTILKRELPQDPQTILDLGCSVGLSTIALQALYPHAQMTGLDLSPYFLTVAQHRNSPTHPSIQWVHTAAEQTPFADRSFDLVSTFLMCHELPQSATKAILQEAKRLLTPGGHLAIMDMNPQSEAFLKLPPYVFALLKSTEPYLDDYFTLDMERALAEAGFESPKVFCNSPRHRTFVAKAKS